MKLKKRNTNCTFLQQGIDSLFLVGFTAGALHPIPLPCTQSIHFVKHICSEGILCKCKGYLMFFYLISASHNLAFYQWLVSDNSRTVIYNWWTQQCH